MLIEVNFDPIPGTELKVRVGVGSLLPVGTPLREYSNYIGLAVGLCTSYVLTCAVTSSLLSHTVSCTVPSAASVQD